MISSFTCRGKNFVKFLFFKKATEVAESLLETKAVTFNSRDYIVLIHIFMKVVIAVSRCFFDSSVLNSTHEPLIIWVNLPQHLLGAANVVH